ncbi:MAG: PorV/PorQ family protein [candidate division Zixibacteria bacterium]|nr:PorV/PorQ family protein [candidate division Zixibacteria bacterium]
MRAIRQWSLVLILALAPAIAHSGDSRRLGTSGALELLIPTGARGVAMGGSVMAENGGNEAWFWNPAGAAAIAGNQITFSHREYIAGIGLDQVDFAHNAGSAGVLGLSAKVLSSGDEPVYTTHQPDGTGETFSSTFVVAGASYARTLTDRVCFGVNAHYVAEKIYNETAQGLAFDVGFLYRPALSGLTFGVVVKNFGTKMKFDGPDFAVPGGGGSGNTTREIRTQSASFELPSFIQFGFAWDTWKHANYQWRVVGAFQSNNFSEDEFRVGTEWGISNQLFLRGGYTTSSLERYLYGFSAGAGVRLPIGATETRVDYAWSDAGVFNNNHLFTVTFAF